MQSGAQPHDHPKHHVHVHEVQLSWSIICQAQQPPTDEGIEMATGEAAGVPDAASNPGASPQVMHYILIDQLLPVKFYSKLRITKILMVKVGFHVALSNFLYLMCNTS